MLKFLTHKLRTHSINEDNYIDKGDEDHDSGTESDEEIDNPELSPEIVMSERASVSPSDTGCSGGSSPPPSMDTFHDPHSSEEELEVINSPMMSTTRPIRSTRAVSVCLPEKRKWSQVINAATEYSNVMDFTYGIVSSPENEENMSHYGNLSPRRITPISPYGKLHVGGTTTPSDTPVTEHSGGSSDDEVQHLLHASMATPVQFRTSPPLEALKPGGRAPSSVAVAAATVKGRSLSPPPKLIHCEVSPRKRSRHTRHAHVQRPCLDFEKMQQLKARSVTAWRHSGDHGGELSVFCW